MKEAQPRREPARKEDEPQARFPLGQTLITPGAIAACSRAEVTPEEYFARHQAGDWGDLGDEDKQSNEDALENDGRLLSRYNLPTDDKLWIITEWDRSATTALLPEEY